MFLLVSCTAPDREPDYHPAAREILESANLKRLQNSLTQTIQQRGCVPELSEVASTAGVDGQAHSLRDRYGGEFRLVVEQGSVEIHSAGRDKTWETPDDERTAVQVDGGVSHCGEPPNTDT